MTDLHDWSEMVEAGPPEDPLTCHRCGAEMVERRNRKTGAPFWGCSAYPRCTGMRRWREAFMGPAWW